MGIFLLLFVVGVIVIPLSYMAYLLLPYNEDRPFIIIPRRERRLLRLICFYPSLSMLLVLLSGLMERHVEMDYTNTNLFTGAHVLLSILSAACSNYVFAGSRWGNFFYVVNVIIGCMYGGAFVFMFGRFH